LKQKWRKTALSRVPIRLAEWNCVKEGARWHFSWPSNTFLFKMTLSL
jgi:hypothetical protein